MMRSGWLLGIAVATGALSGCVERRFIVNTDQPGAMVYRDGQAIGQTPVIDHFTWYGNMHFTIVKDGFATLQVDQEVPTPWYEYFPLEFFSENLVPWRIEDVRRFEYQMQPIQIPPVETALERGGEMRGVGQGIGSKTPASGPPPAVVQPNLPPVPGAAPYMPPFQPPMPPADQH